MNSLLLKKMFVAFLVAFAGVFIPATLNILDDVANNTPHHFDKAALISLVAGAFAAAVRAVLAISPLNLVPSDSQHTLGGNKQ